MKFSLLFMVLLPIYAGAETINGRVTDVHQQPLAYATVYLRNTSIGTTSNEDGYYSLDAPAGSYEIVFQHIGYRKFSREVTVAQQPVTIHAVLEAESVMLKEVTVTSGAEDPAYEIIRQAQRKRKVFLNQVYEYSCDVYIKGIQGLDRIPEKIFGMRLEKQGIDSSMLGIVYLSESESRYHFQKPDKVKEIVFSSKVAGNNNAFSWNSAEAFSSSFYENLIPLEGVTARGLVSPIADGAFTFYNYKLLGTFYDEGLLINKIQVIPKRKTDPVFSGIIYIIEDQWRIHSLDLLVTKEAHLDFIDSLRFIETFGRVNDTVWMPFNQILQFKLDVLGFSGDGKFVGVFSNYNLSPDFPPGFFDAERLKVNDDANKKDSLYWEEHRPVPLTTTEHLDYRKKDSTYAVQHSEHYMDSVDRVKNKFKVQSLFLGYTYHKSYDQFYYTWRNPLLGLSYNTVEGFNLTLRNTLRRILDEERQSWTAYADFRYGFSNRRFGARASFSFEDDPIRFQEWFASAGIFPTQINRNEPISELVNAAYTLVATQNFMKIYENRYLTFSHEREWFNGFDLTASAAVRDRLPLDNTTNYSFDWVEGNTFTPNSSFNNPNADTLVRTQALLLYLKASITFGQTYFTRPDRRIITGSRFPTIDLEYRKGIFAFGSDVNFDFLQLGIDHTIGFGLVGRADVNVVGGLFLNNRNLTIIDFRHFQGNQTIFGSHYANAYQLLPYYDYSTDDSWFEGHYEHHFGGFIFNKIPLLKKLNVHEVVGGHFLLTPDLSYFELDAGLEHLFKLVRIDYVMSFDHTGQRHDGFLIGLNLGGAVRVE
jgi:hypothetical protein